MIPYTRVPVVIGGLIGQIRLMLTGKNILGNQNKSALKKKKDK